MRTWADRRYRRRAVLRAGAGIGLGLLVIGGSGCGLLDRGPDTPPPPDPLAPLRAQARDLAERYAATMAAVPGLAERLRPVQAAHAIHVTELDKIIGVPSPSPQPSTNVSAPPVDPAAALTALRAAEESAAKDATAACLAAPATRAAVVGSIAACRATHVEMLR